MTIRLRIDKPNQSFVFTFELAELGDLLAVLPDMVHRDDINFDWADALIVSHRAGQLFADFEMTPASTREES